MSITDEWGTWHVDGDVKMLIEPSETFLNKKESENLAQEEQKLIDSLIPSQEDILKAETELQIIELLMEVGLI